MSFLGNQRKRRRDTIEPDTMDCLNENPQDMERKNITEGSKKNKKANKRRTCEKCAKRPCFNLPGETAGRFCSQHKELNMVNVISKKCECCDRRPGYNHPGSNRPRFCNTHKEEGMVDVVTKRCECCDKRPSYNHPGSNRPRFCNAHKEEGMVNIVTKRCEKAGCSTSASYNKPGCKGKRFCYAHKEVGMIDMNRRCEQNGCGKQASFNHSYCERPRFCAKHKEEDMVDVVSKRCECCKKRPRFNLPGCSQPRFCSKHKLGNMVDVLGGKCEKCRKQPSFGSPGSGHARFCKEHKEDGMVDVKKRPICELCIRRATFGPSGSKYPRFCSKHKEKDMVDVTSKKCGLCGKQPSFNFPDCKKPRFCFEHKQQGMIDVRSSRRCKECTRQSRYGLPGSSPSHCSDHKSAGMITRPKKECTEVGCKEVALYGTYIALRCEKHRWDDDTDFVQRMCIKCGLPNIVDIDGVCDYCNPILWKTRRLAKQKEIKELLDVNRIEYLTYDSIVDIACSRKRPDFRIDAATHIVVLEVDEHGHSDYECELARMVELTQAEGGKPVIWIRYNPDTFRSDESKPSQWDSRKRQRLLLEWIGRLRSDKYIPKDGNEYLRVVHLFYDDFDPKKIKVESIDIIQEALKSASVTTSA